MPSVRQLSNGKSNMVISEIIQSISIQKWQLSNGKTHDNYARTIWSPGIENMTIECQ